MPQPFCFELAQLRLDAFVCVVCCFLASLIWMPHCRSALGAWKHRQKSYQRGFVSRPPAAISVELPPPPPPPIFIGDELLEDVLLPPLRHLFYVVLSKWGTGDEFIGTMFRMRVVMFWNQCLLPLCFPLVLWLCRNLLA